MADTLREAILEHHARHPDRLYVRCVAPDGSDERISYGTLTGRGSQFAAVYTSLGSNPGAIVIIILPHCADLYCAFFGAVLGGQIPSILAVPSFKLNAEHWQHELEALLNRISLIPVNPKKFPRINSADTATFVAWLTAPDKGQRLVAEFGREKYGASLFFPDSREWHASRSNEKGSR